MDYKILLLYLCCLISLIILSTFFRKWKNMRQGVCLIGLESFIFIVCYTTLQFPAIISLENTSWNSVKNGANRSFYSSFNFCVSFSKSSFKNCEILSISHIIREQNFFLSLRRNSEKWGKNFLEIHCRKKIIS